MKVEEIYAITPDEDGWRKLPNGNDVSLGDGVKLGDDSVMGSKSSDGVDLGFVDGYRKVIAQINGVAWIGAGCRWFTLAEAKRHWSLHPENRQLTMALMLAATEIARIKGWKEE